MQSFKGGSRGTQILKVTKLEVEKIYYVFIHEQSQSAFVTTVQENVYQISLRSRKIINKYSDLGIESIYSLSSFGNLLCVAGKHGLFTLINIPERRLITIEPVKTRIGSIFCSQFSIIDWKNRPTVVLVVSGGKSLFIFLFIYLK